MKLQIKSTFLLLVFLSFTQASVASGINVPETIDGTTRVSAEELINLVVSKLSLVIIDARKKSDYHKGYIQGAVNVPNTETTPEKLAKYIKSKATPVLFYCNGVNCGRSVVSARIAVHAGYKEIYWFRGGMEEWENKGLPLVYTH